MPPPLPPESHYDPKKLQKIFAIATLVLLVSLFGVFAKDYAREWKTYQRQFRALEVEKTRVKLDAQNNELAKNEDYQKVLKELKTVQDGSKSQALAVVSSRQRITNAQTVKELYVQQSQFVKADLDALKYRYEQAAGKGQEGAPELKIQLDILDARMEQLRLKIEAQDDVIKARTNDIQNIEKDARDLDKKRLAVAKKAEILQRKLKRIDLQEMSPADQLAEAVRDMPFVELANPNYKIRQIVLKDIPEDMNFMKVPRVDRCTTCHLGIDNPDFKDVGQPFRAHPDLEMFVDKNSPHPMDSFACTTCHMGRGRATDFVSAAHTPRNEEQKKEWQKKYGWKESHHWDQPMLAAQSTQASCFKCHQDQTVIKGAPILNFGLNLIERAGCYACHTIKKYKGWPKTGPSLEFLASKTTMEWAYQWIANPKALRPNTWMPSYFDQSNTNDPASIKRNQQEIHAIVAFLFANSKPFKAQDAPQDGDPVKGKELVSSLGCMACHQVGPQKTDVKRDRGQLQREFGPNLVGLGSKTSRAWLFDWLKNPPHYHPESKMPNMRLSDTEASDIAAYLAQDVSLAAAEPIVPVDEQTLDTIVLDLLKKSETVESSKARIRAMSTDEKLTFAGRRLVREYGCFSCHNIPGFENEKPIGTELTEEGSKSIERLDFGFADIEHSKEAWFKQKMLDPRIFDKGRVKEALEKLKMPNFNFTEEEAQAITTALMGFVKDRPDPSKMPNQGVKAAFINEGQRIVRQFNCQGCHVIEGEGGAIQSTVVDWLVAYQGKETSDARSVVRSFSPPDLVGEGQKVQAQWLFEFLHGPTPIRPWLHVRMPTYSFHAGQINSLVKYFNYLDDQEFPFTDIYHPQMSKEEFEAAGKLFSKDYFGCAQCHIVGDQMPGGSADSWAPNFALTAKRLKPDWIIQWLTDPADLLPGTKMPTYFDPKNFDESGPADILNGDERRQIKALRDYLLTISSDPAPSTQAGP
ncbi:MAG: c-type cytochrome [Candidatus Omnitrophota bacterium]|nr:c-type cytochrome [Candidatus Omnitrophota bacterium]